MITECVKHGVDKVRINPGNIGEKWKVKEVAEACKYASIPIRIGVNGGSLDKKLLAKYSHPCAEALAESALTEAEALEDCGFSDIVISIKSSNVAEMIKASTLVREASSYPLHLGVTEAGDDYTGLVKNSIGIGSLLLSGIGDTIRVSLTADPIEEVRAGMEILSAVGMNARGRVNVVSCPTCGRTRINLIAEMSSAPRTDSNSSSVSPPAPFAQSESAYMTDKGENMRFPLFASDAFT